MIRHRLSEDMDARGLVVASPGPGLPDPVTDDLSAVVTSAVTPTKRTCSKGMVPGVFPVTLNNTGDMTHRRSTSTAGGEISGPTPTRRPNR